MEKNNFGEVEWVIHLSGNKVTTIEKAPQIVEEQNASPTSEQSQDEKEALKALEQIVEACKEIKGECLEALAHQQEKELDEQASDVSKNINGLFEIILEFTRLIKKLRKSGEDPKSS